MQKPQQTLFTATPQIQIGIPKESQKNEARVSASPASVSALQKLGFAVVVAKDAGAKAGFSDDEYKNNGATIATQNQALSSDIVLVVNAPSSEEIKQLKKGAILIGLLGVAHDKPLLESLNAQGINALSMDCVPRISRAQSMDALSSMANIAGYRAIIEASFAFGRFFGGQITAAGKIPPAKVLVIGAGVAGLASIGTANSLGAVVHSFDTRPEVKEQVESMGAEFLEINIKEEAGAGDGYAKVMSQAYINAEMELFASQAKEVDIIITTALIPGKPAPKLITKQMVESMRQGSVIVDLAAQNGGNCELTKANELITSKNGVKIIGYTDLPSRLPTQSSQLYATNVLNLLKLMCEKSKTSDKIDIDFDDEILRGACVCKDGQITFPPPPIKVSATQKPANDVAKSSTIDSTKDDSTKEDGTQHSADLAKSCPLKKIWHKYSSYAPLGLGIVAVLAFFGICANAPSEFLSHFMVFALACVVGYYVVWNVNHALHTPLMSVTNAISGIIVVGALLQMGEGSLISVLAFVGVFIASINIFGGFFVTQRMLKMFRLDKDEQQGKTTKSSNAKSSKSK